VGGALGGILIGFVAPYVFKGFWELPLGLVLCWLLFLVMNIVFKTPNTNRLKFSANWVLLLSAVLISSARSYQQIHADLSNDLLIERNFYGVVRVKAISAQPGNSLGYALVHGVTVHGVQFVGAALSHMPTSYFGETGGGGLAILNSPRRGTGMRVGILGLGIGTLAAYGQPGDIFRFYEINPIIIRLAEGDGGYFTYLSDCQARVEIVPGDARLSLESELMSGKPQNYDVLALDVFSGDSIPVHLLDSEAFDLYLKHLAPDGILAVHISNRHLDLIPVVWTLADHFKLNKALIDDPGNGITTNRSLWVLLARTPSLLAIPQITSHTTPMPGYSPRIRLWTDDYNNLFQILY
jgi:hypothetical protein